MKTIAIIFLTMWMAAFAEAAGTTNIAALINGKRVEFTSDVRAQAAQKAVALLASCAYMNAKPNWGATSIEPQRVADVEKQPHLRLVFSSPVRVEVPIEKVTLQVREIVISLPLATAGIWVRTDDGVQYFAKFDCPLAQELEKILKEAQK
jgi:hypothetical protein